MDTDKIFIDELTTATSNLVLQGAAPGTSDTEGGLFTSNGGGGLNNGSLYYRAPSSGAVTELAGSGGAAFDKGQFVHVTSTSSQSFTSAFTTLTPGWTTSLFIGSGDEDDQGLFNLGTGVFTAPEAGLYEYILTMLYYSSGTNQSYLTTNVNGSSTPRHFRMLFSDSAGSQPFNTVCINDIVRLDAGDTLEMRVSSGSPGITFTLGSTGTNTLTIRRVRS